MEREKKKLKEKKERKKKREKRQRGGEREEMGRKICHVGLGILDMARKKPH